MPRARKTRKPKVEGECVIPPTLPPVELRKYVINGPPHEARAITAYMEGQWGDTVAHLEKVATEPLFSGRLDAWDVHTDKGRYWVITNPTNLYPQDTFKSLDFAITVHVGLTTRMRARTQSNVEPEQEYRLSAAWRRVTQAREALDVADEAEAFQAVGMRCRECLLELARAIATPDMVPANETPPQVGNFLRWSELIAHTIAGGRHAGDIRTYLKQAAASTWQLVNWLTHSANATRFDADITLDATQNVVDAFGMALVRYMRGEPDRCSLCRSYRLAGDYRPDLGVEEPWVTVCASCGAVHIPHEPVVDIPTENGHKNGLI